MAFGKIYETSWWGSPVNDGWGDIYYIYVDPIDTWVEVETTWGSETRRYTDF